MRHLLILSGIAFVCAGLVGWVTIGNAQPAPEATPGSVPISVSGIGEFGDPLPVIPKIGNTPEPTPIRVPDPIAMPTTKGDAPLLLPVRPAIAIPTAPETGDVVPLPKISSESVPVPTPMPTPKPIRAPMTLPDIDLLKPEAVEPPVTILKPEILRATPSAPRTPETASSAMPNPTGRQEPSVSLEWIGPAAVKVGQPTEYSIVVRNTSAIPVQKVVVQVRVPVGATGLSTEPKAEGTGNVLLWEVGTLNPKQDKPLKLKMTPPGRGELSCQAWVTFTGSSIMKMMVREPKLLLKARAPEKVLVGDPANVVMDISNPGDHMAESVKLTATFSEGLESSRGNRVSFDLGVLEAGQTRSISIPCGARAGGKQKVDIYVEAEGGLKVAETVAIDVVQPKLDIELVGPKMRYLNRKAVYTYRITNPGNATATNVYVTNVVPAGFRFVNADSLGQHDFATRTVKWFLPEVAPGQTREVKVEMMAEATGDQNNRVTVNASRGMKAEKAMATKIEGLSAMSMEVRATENPVEVGSDTTYEIVVTNSGSNPEADLKLVCTLPPQVKLKSVAAPVKYSLAGSEMIFEPLSKLAPRGDVIYKVTVTATGKGDARFRTQISSATMGEPLTKTESTRVYED